MHRLAFKIKETAIFFFRQYISLNCVDISLANFCMNCNQFYEKLKEKFSIIPQCRKFWGLNAAFGQLKKCLNELTGRLQYLQMQAMNYLSSVIELGTLYVTSPGFKNVSWFPGEQLKCIGFSINFLIWCKNWKQENRTKAVWCLW